KRRGPALLKPLLLVEFFLLVGVFIIGVAGHPAANPKGLTADFAGMIAVSAMACQYTLLRLAVPGPPATAVMTGNITEAVLSLLETLSSREPLLKSPEERLTKSAYLLLGFIGGCIAGAAGFSWMGDGAWSMPAVLVGLAVTFHRSAHQ